MCSSRVSARFLALVGVALTALMALVAALDTTAASPSAAVSVIGDDEAERYVGSGAVLLPSTVSWGVRAQASTCVGCRWKVTAPCLRDEDHSDAGCRGTILGCPQGREISRAWLARPGGDFEPVGLFCPSDGEVTSVVDAMTRVRGGFERNIPGLSVDCEPGRGVVVGIPMHCRSLQPTSLVSWTDSVAGYSVRTTATASWEWTFRQRGPSGADAGQWFHVVDQPGSSYPDWGIRQGFTIPGMHWVDVRARWRGTFTVDGLGPFPIAPDLEQHARLRIPTGSALGVIVAPGKAGVGGA